MLRNDEGQRTTASSTGKQAIEPATDKAFEDADVGGPRTCTLPRIHPAPHRDLRLRGGLSTGHGQTDDLPDPQAPHAHRTVFALVGGIPEQKIRIISPDIGGGFGNKVPVYPGYVSRWWLAVIGRAGQVD